MVVSTRLSGCRVIYGQGCKVSIEYVPGLTARKRCIVGTNQCSLISSPTRFENSFFIARIPMEVGLLSLGKPGSVFGGISQMVRS